MKQILSLLALVMGLTFMTPTPAAARGSVPYGTKHSLDFITEMGSVPGVPGQNVSLCHHTVRNHVAFLGYWARSEGYVMSTTGCEGNSYMRLRDGQFAAMQAAGFIPADLPEVARMTPQQFMIGFGWLILLGLFAAFQVLHFLLHGRKSGGGSRGALGSRTLTAMCVVAKCDGHIDQEEEKAIRFAYEKIMGKRLTDMEIRTVLAKTPQVASAREMEFLGAGMNEADRQTIMRGALLVACSDGEIHEAEHRVIGHLAQALIIPAPHIMSMVRDFAGLLRTPVAAAPA